MSTVATVWNTRSHIRPAKRQAEDLALSPATSGNVVECGDFRIDLEMRSATVRGRSLHLSSAEFDVLVFLTAHRRRLVTSHTKLATRAQAGVRHTEFLPAFLSLRKKLEEEVPANRYMQTEAWILFDFHPGNEGRP